MNKLMRTAIGVALSAVVAAAPASGLQKSKKSEKASSDGASAAVTDALQELAAWQNKAARRTLEKAKDEAGSSSEYKAAWALLEFQENLADNTAAADAAARELSQTAKSSGAGPISLYYQGEVAYLQQKNNEASSAWQAAADSAAEMVAKDKKDAVSQFYLGAALVRVKKFDQALAALQAAEREGFSKAMVNHQVGFVYLFQQKWDQAKEAFDAGLEADPRYAPMYYWRAMTWDKLGRKDNMLLDLDQYVKLAPDGPEAGKARAILKSAGG